MITICNLAHEKDSARVRNVVPLTIFFAYNKENFEKHRSTIYAGEKSTRNWKVHCVSIWQCACGIIIKTCIWMLSKDRKAKIAPSRKTFNCCPPVSKHFFSSSFTVFILVLQEFHGFSHAQNQKGFWSIQSCGEASALWSIFWIPIDWLVLHWSL